MQFDHEKIHYSCPYCTSLYFPEENRDGIRLTDEAASLDCPLCRLPLVIAYAGKIKLLSCPNCRGILIQQPDFLFTINYLRANSKEPPITPPPLRKEDLERVINCPNCRQKMHTHPYGGPGNIVIDNCPACLLNWLDHTELHRIIRSPDRLARDPYKGMDFEQLFRSQKKRKKLW